MVNISFGEKKSLKNSGTLDKAFTSKTLFDNLKNIKNILNINVELKLLLTDINFLKCLSNNSG